MTDVAQPAAQASDPVLHLVITMVRACIAFGTGLFGPDVPPTLGPDTTVIVEPLAADGLPDYAAHARKLLGSGTPPEENAAVPLLAACWPMRIREKDLPIICREIGIPNRPPEFRSMDDGWPYSGEMLQALTRFTERHFGPGVSWRSATALRDITKRSPWKADELPELRDWLEEHAIAMDMFLDASDRPTFYLPNVKLLQDNRTDALCTAHFEVSAVGRASRGLSTRAMLHIGQGQPREAWRDILANHRLARLAAGPGQRGTIIGGLVGMGVSGDACDATLRLLDAPGVTAAETAGIYRDLQRLPPIVNRSGWWAFEQLTAVACVTNFAALPRHTRATRIEEYYFFHSDHPGPGQSLLLSAGIDWNVVLRSVNRFVTAIRDASCQPRWHDRQVSLLALDQQLDAERGRADPREAAKRFFGWRFDRHHGNKIPPLQEVVVNLASWLESWLRASMNIADDRAARSEVVGRSLWSLLFAGIKEADRGLTIAEARIALTRLAAALAVWRSGKGHGSYPARLDDLVPDVLPELPTDPFTGKPFVYDRRGDGYLLYSLGPNEKDDHGTAYNDSIVKGEWSDDTSHIDKPENTDIVVRLPIPKVPILEQLRAASRRDAERAEARARQATSQPER